MKAIMISIKPKWCAKIMNGIKTIEVRKNKALAKATQKLIDEYGYADIYVYCSKDSKNGLYFVKEYVCVNQKGCISSDKNGKVLFKFRCYKVEEIPTRRFSVYTYPYTETLDDYELLDKSCLSTGELENYFGDNVGYAIHISDLEIFDRPKELSDFKRCQLLWNCEPHDCINCRHLLPLTKGPQNFVYIESEEK